MMKWFILAVFISLMLAVICWPSRDIQIIECAGGFSTGESYQAFFREGSIFWWKTHGSQARFIKVPENEICTFDERAAKE